ncbi:nitrilase-related carbon-nitrogen hydrolase [Streptomyces sp. NPDC059740]|uniref:nitrilase-related carbon-nitrogen hydrolase n=1 Tax=Streptomyces sp. NPDC059740 TaxID=3346926 RepID=UPI0036460E4C
MTRLVCRPLAPVVGDLAGNQRRVLETLATLSTAGADVIVLPELVTSGYVFTSQREAASCALAADGPELAQWSAALTGDTVAVAGFAERAPDGRLFNSAALVDAGGVRAVHRKAHLWDREKLFFAPGSHPAPVVETAFGRLAVMICYDLEFPEYTRQAALAGADMLAVPVNWPLVPRPTGERPPEVVIGQAAARVNRMVVACCDRVGTERGQEWTEGTTVIGADGWVLASGGPGSAEDGVWADVDLTAGRAKALTEHADLFADRRPDLYGA